MSVRLKNVDVLSPNRWGPSLPVVADVNFEIGFGEILAIIGPNGAGKSSILKAISNEWPHIGEITIAGLATRDVERARQLAVLPQSSNLNFAYRVFEVIGLARIPHASGTEVDQEILCSVLKLMDIEHLRDRFYTQLSGGEKQRVQLARVLAQIWRVEDAPTGTRVLILDEPTTALDIGHQHQLLDAIRVFSQQGVAVILVLHDVNLASRYADKLLAVHEGKVLAVGSPNDVITTENIKALFDLEARIECHPISGKPVVWAV